jgi:hypothetical protein
MALLVAVQSEWSPAAYRSEDAFREWLCASVAPARTALVGVYPNPFNPSTHVTFSLAATQAVRLAVYDLQGNRVRTLVDEERPAGRHEAVWDGRDTDGRGVASGVYMARLVSGGVSEMRKMILLK